MSDPRPAWIDVVNPKDATSPLRELYDQVADRETRQVDHILQVHSLHPNGLQGHFQLYASAMRSTRGLPKVDRELIAFVVSDINECHY